MEIKVFRKRYTANSTTGELHIDGKFFCYTLEDTCRDLNRDGHLSDPGEEKVFGKTCIPSGLYQVIISFSPRFKRYMPLVMNVPGFSGIRIHNGNTADHTEGCLLVGSTISKDFVGNSKSTFKLLMDKLTAAEKKERITIQYIDQPAASLAA